MNNFTPILSRSKRKEGNLGKNTDEKGRKKSRAWVGMERLQHVVLFEMMQLGMPEP